MGLVAWAYALIFVYAGVSYLTFALAILGLWSRGAMLGLLGLLAVALVLAQARLRALLAAMAGPDTSGCGRLLGGVLGALVLVLSHILFLPPFREDDLIYHLEIPKRIVQLGSYSFDPYSLNTNFPALFEMPLVLSEMSSGAIPPFLANLVCLTLVGVLFATILTQHFQIGRLTTLLGTVALVLTPVNYSLLTSCYVDLFLTLLVLASFDQFLRYRVDPSRPVHCFTAVALAGLAAATKYPGVLLLAAYAVYAFFAHADKRRWYLGVCLGAALASPWYLRNLILLGNPVFPFLPHIFESSYLSPSRYHYMNAIMNGYNQGTSLLDYMLLPIRLLHAPDHLSGPNGMGFGGKLSWFYALTFVGAIAHRRTKGAAFFAWIFAVHFVVWAATSQIARYLLAFSVPMLPLGIAWWHSRARAWAVPTLNVFLVFVLGQQVFALQAQVRSEKIADLLLGQIGRDAFVRHHNPTSFSAAELAQPHLQAETDRLMTVGLFGRSYHFAVPTLANTYYDSEIFDEAFRSTNPQPALVDEFFARERLTHLLLNEKFLVSFHRESREFASAAFANYLGERFVEVARNDRVVLYRYSP